MTKLILTTAMCMALTMMMAPSTQAFTPAFVSSSRNALPAVYQPGQNLLPVGARVGRTTALQMNLFDRFSRVAKSNLNNILKSLEDPEKIMNQALEDMQNDLVKIRQSYAQGLVSTSSIGLAKGQ
eukprot:CAMPEP_0170347844 /NCGR_PEP_ID=MMETSP0116_2-20130129/75188_1 /TAXON_ID=400756 /ORGANISM="Durinskia baltica, Strain CSIRO CS-38" /LENGTH=124 /DNA_ID=CAMNT_0010601679 /DNA_START=62 /DNA_END=436 /DNA_ORIENTATION=-